MSQLKVITTSPSRSFRSAKLAADGTKDGRACLCDEASFRKRAAQVYERYRTELRGRFAWMRPSLFLESLETDLKNDAQALLQVLKTCGSWDARKDAKLNAIEVLLTKK